ncbi:hypothetical protein ACFWYW_38385 [Nonomuraea sp. NPDC059023]|uniref:hypothetical protein n=1 Tax=unclassified Nonomuraea TaxID=2593643 RepID=UPI003674270C
MSTGKGLEPYPLTRAEDTNRYVALQRSPAFARLRSRSRRYLAWSATLYLGTFTVTVVLSRWMPGVPRLMCALGLIALPVLVAVVHLVYARRRLDPLADRIRAEFEGSRR